MNVDQWLAANGGPRRFAKGDTGDMFNLRPWLAERGYELGSQRLQITIRRIGARGRPKQMTHREAMAFVDQLRIAEGLEPISATSRVSTSIQTETPEEA